MQEEDDLEVVWSGGMELLPPRDQRPDPTWLAPKRKYTKKVDNPSEQGETEESDE